MPIEFVGVEAAGPAGGFGLVTGGSFGRVRNPSVGRIRLRTSAVRDG